MFAVFVAVLPGPVAYIPILFAPFTLIVPLFIMFPVSVVEYPAAIPIPYKLLVASVAPIVIVPLFVAVPPLIL